MQHIAIIGGGPAALFMMKRIVESHLQDVRVSIFERSDRLGAGMPYSSAGANPEHITNVSANEIPEINEGMLEWLHHAPASLLKAYDIDPLNFSAFRVFPRLLFGRYLSDQFRDFLEMADAAGIKVNVHLNTDVIDILPLKDLSGFSIKGREHSWEADSVIICTGHYWPAPAKQPAGYFHSPYPPSKLSIRTNHPVAIKGASLTAIDAIRTLSRFNGTFTQQHGRLVYNTDKESKDFKLVLHTRNGMLPAVRFHLDNPQLFRPSVLTDEQIAAHREDNGGFIALDFIFDKNYKELFRDTDPLFYEKISKLKLEGFVDMMLNSREKHPPFELLRLEYQEAEYSIRRHESIVWKELLAVLSFTLNTPAKYFSAEDYLRLQAVLMPLISLVIAFIPQRSCLELLALHEAGVLDLEAVGADAEFLAGPEKGVMIRFKDVNGEIRSEHYRTYVDCVGQPHLTFEDFPFKGLVEAGMIYPATLEFSKTSQVDTSRNDLIIKEKKVFLKVPGVAITDHFQAADLYGAAIPNLFIMAVPYIGGYNPDYSGLDFCDAASEKIVYALSKLS